MAEAILVPQVGQDLTEAKIVELHVKLGDPVEKGDLVAVVESEKASFDVEAFSAGVVIDLPYAEGDIATVLAPLMHLGEAGEPVPDAASADAEAAVSEAGAASSAPAVSQVGTPEDAQGAAGRAAPVGAASGDTLRASPVARRMAQARGLDIARIAGSGPRGAVVLRDVDAAAEDVPAMLAPSGSGGIALRTLQSGQGAAVVFIHGFGADLSSWRPMVGQLPADRPLLALDLPGHGNSAAHGAADFASIVEAVGQAVRTASGGVHLVGHSLGAAVAAALTERGDLDIRSLTLIAPAGLGPSIDGSFIEGFLAARSEAALTAWMRRLVADPASLAPVLVRATLEAREDPALVEAQARLARGVFEGSTQLFSAVDALHRFAGPSAVIAGRDDAIVPFRETAPQVPGHVAFHRLAGVGHLPQVEAAELVPRIILRTIRAAG